MGLATIDPHSQKEHKELKRTEFDVTFCKKFKLLRERNSMLHFAKNSNF